MNKAINSLATRGGLYYPESFDAKEGMVLVNRLLSATPANNPDAVDQEVHKKLGYKRTSFLNNDSPGKAFRSAHAEALEFFDAACRDIGRTVQKPFLTVIEYQPESFMLPHQDRGASNPLFSLSGRGVFETFYSDDDTISEITNGNYPDTAVTSLEINPGDIFLSFGNVLHGFKNSSEPRVVVGLLDSNLVTNQ